MRENEPINEQKLAEGLRYVEHVDEAEVTHKYLAKPIGHILPGRVKVEEIILGERVADQDPNWTVTISAPSGGTFGLPMLEATLRFVTSDAYLINQLRHRKLRFALDLLQLEETEGETGDGGGMLPVGVEKTP